MIKKMLIIIFVLLLSCSYSVYTNSYPYLKTIKIATFSNNTTEYELEENLLLKLTDLFEKDGRLKIVDLNPDCKLEGEILDYSNKIYSYGNENVDEYEVKILFKIIFTDLKKNKILYQNNSLVLSETYSGSNELSEFKTEEEAQNKIYQDLFDTIMKESLEK
ncbi:MAG: hypothetical protein B6D62_00620 [Candidatus Cloacimonas sp. 4484_275]|nr:MAG: hypothetical protein B6D62_00620 [Candidatus Cloacimonas sp. 4484_275]